MLHLFSQQLADEAFTALNELDSVAGKLGLKPPPLSSSAEEVLAHLFLRKPGENHFASAELRRFAVLRRARNGIGATAGVLAALLAGAAVIAIVFFIVKKTWFGRIIRATSQDREMAELNGVDTTRLNMLSFGLGCALAAAAGVILTPVFPVTPTAGVPVALTAFVVVVLGGMGSMWGCVVGGLLVGLFENLGAAFISTGYKNVFGFVILILVLLIRPSGLFGRAKI